MTAHKHLKQLIRARMEKTGERYAAARHHVVQASDAPSSDTATRWHFAGSVPAATTLRTLLTHAGVRAPHTGKPFTEAMLFGIAGGIGIGVISFHYRQASMSTLFLGGRHHWYDEKAYLTDAIGAFDIGPVIRETSGARTAERQLEDTLSEYGPCAAWVEGYRVLTVYQTDADAATAQIGDLTDEPATITLEELTKRRAVVKQQKFRLLAVPPSTCRTDLASLVDGGLRRCVDGLLNPTIPQMKNNARLEAIQTWADRIHGSDGKESWSQVFKPGPNLWRGLWSIFTFVECYGTGGGLARPLFADFLNESAAALKRPGLAELAKRYTDLGRQWSELADAALPDGIPDMRTAKDLHIRKAELKHAADSDAMRELNCRESEMEKRPFPMNDSQVDTLLRELKGRILQIYHDEIAAFRVLQGLVS